MKTNKVPVTRVLVDGSAVPLCSLLLRSRWAVEQCGPLRAPLSVPG